MRQHPKYPLAGRSQRQSRLRNAGISTELNSRGRERRHCAPEQLRRRGGVRSSLWWAANDRGSEIVDVRQSRSGDDRVAERAEEAVAIVVGERVLWTDAGRPGAIECVGREDRAGNLL